LRAFSPAIVEQLITPLQERSRVAFGTLWLVHHDPALRFSSEDARVLEHLGAQLTLAIRIRERVAAALAQRQLLEHNLAEAGEVRDHAELAVRESNHRVKNTLQVAMSLLSLHARATSSTAVRQALQESSARLRVLAQVHEMLQRSSDARDVEMHLLLETLAQAWRQSFSSAEHRVLLRTTSEDIVLRSDEAIPLALLMNEAVSNAYKHAFPGDAVGTIAVHLSRASSNGIVLRIMDDGIGMPDVSASGLGLSLVRGLAAQLRAALTLATPEDSSGTILTLRLYVDQQGAARLTDRPV
jgi:two-component sensor histidine kinase